MREVFPSQGAQQGERNKIAPPLARVPWQAVKIRQKSLPAVWNTYNSIHKSGCMNSMGGCLSRFRKAILSVTRSGRGQLLLLQMQAS